MNQSVGDCEHAVFELTRSCGDNWELSGGSESDKWR
jgi:hypothetical protein